MPKGRPQLSIPAFAVVAIGVTAVVAIPVVAWHVDRSADEFSGSHVPPAVTAGWAICALLVALVATRELHLVAPVDEGAGIALSYDALPILLAFAWAVAIIALLAALLMPMLGLAREKGWQTVCLNNQHQIALALSLRS